MDKNLIFEALLDWNFWGRFKEDLKEREVYPKLPESETCLIIKGVRRCGKSRLSYLLSRSFDEKEVVIINFEDVRLSDLEGKDILSIIEIFEEFVNPNGPKLIVLDEVQNISGWEKAARVLIETKKSKVIITGSSSKLLSEEYSTVLTGRHLDFELFPLSFREYLMWNDIKLETLEIYKEKKKILHLLNNYMRFGGFPEIAKIKDENEKRKLLQSYFEDILTKDVVMRYKIREVEKLEKLANNYLTNISTEQSYNKMKNIVSVSLDTVERMSRYLETAGLFIFLKKFSYSFKEQLLAPRKVYTIDTGFFNVMGFQFSQNTGKLMENLVAVELFRRKSYYHSNWEIFYLKTKNRKEVDFLIKKGNEIKNLINVSYANSFEEMKRREYTSLLEAKEMFKDHNPELLVITWDYEDEKELSWFGKKGKVKFVPLWKWLIMKD